MHSTTLYASESRSLDAIDLDRVAVQKMQTTLFQDLIISEFQSFSLTIAKFFSMGITVIRHSTKGSLARLSAGLRECGGAA